MTIGVPITLNHEVLSFVLGLCEIIRRFIWNFFRLENEHLNNCGEFRAVRDISIKPIESFQDEPLQQTLLDEGKENLSIEQMMDSETGPLPKRKVVQMLLTSNDNVISRLSTKKGISREPDFSPNRGTKKKEIRRLSSITVI